MTTTTRRDNTAECWECGDRFELPRSAPHKKFCCAACRRLFHNREATRGMELYRLKMAERYERDTADTGRLQTIMNRLCAHWREEDEHQRRGRRSWGDWREYLATNPYLNIRLR